MFKLIANLKNSSRLNILVFSVLMLLMQNVLAQHDIGHQNVEHNEQCQVFHTASGTGLELAITDVVIVPAPVQVIVRSTYSFVELDLIPQYASRAPPIV